MLHFLFWHGRHGWPAVRPNKKRIQLKLQPTEDTVGLATSQSHKKIPMVRIAIEAVVATSFVIIPLSVHAGFFADWFAKTTPEVVAESEPTLALGPADVALLTALQNPNPLAARGGAELIVEDDALVSTGPIGEDEIAELGTVSGEIRVYTVREGDSLSMIAEMFDVTTNTIMWANDITKASAIQPGDTLVILPIAGVRHIVKSGDTISTIAKKYEGDVDEILSYNELATADDIAVGDTLIIPGGAMHSSVAKVSASAQPVRVSGSGSSDTSGFAHPAPGSVKTQGIHGYNAVDLAGSHGSAVRAAAAGEVIVAKASGWNGGYGTYIVVKHANGTQTLYAHLSSINVGVGAYVSHGEVIGAMGSTGKSTGTHLHFEVRGGRNPF